MAGKDKYEVKIDDEVTTVKNKAEVTKTLVEALADGEAHTVEVDEVVPAAKAEKVKEEEPAKATPTDALGIPHLR